VKSTSRRNGIDASKYFTNWSLVSRREAWKPAATVTMTVPTSSGTRRFTTNAATRSIAVGGASAARGADLATPRAFTGSSTKSAGSTVSE